MAELRTLDGDAALAFMVSGGLVYEIIAAACSSPQTTEINADTRSDTLMKWVWIGLAQAAVFVGVAAYISDTPGAVIAGGALGGGLMLAQYLHARQAGLASSAPGTETRR
ncbi:MAG TPA: hypothetical protein VGP90_05945 [Acidimicrobiia bacterium]|jgi:hypothetical protein|nr:hypothetical protein [Acidimicrobiia bacterium]